MSVAEAGRALAAAEHLLITAGAGMGVDSGLPDFRGNDGFWNAYPPYKALGLSFVEMANPESFSEAPELGWGFYGHRLGLYRNTEPHAGFQILRRWAAAKKSAFVVTSNVDGHFQKAGFGDEQVYEIHGSIHHLQCFRPCSPAIESADGVSIAIDESTMRARPPLPSCPRCGVIARPNVLMFGDWSWIDERAEYQRDRFLRWRERAGDEPLLVIELGAGTGVPSIRRLSEDVARRGPRLVRINPREPSAPEGQISLPLGALEALRAMDAALAAQAP